jgi:hypothetical protein
MRKDSLIAACGKTCDSPGVDMKGKRTLRVGAIFLLSLLLGCVTRTERIPYYPHARPQDQSILDELRSEFGWKKSTTRSTGTPFYKRAARGVKETVSGWFREEPPSPLDVEKERLRFETERREALRRAYERQENNER